MNCHFGRQYATYWNPALRSTARMEKRALEAIESVNDQVYQQIERLSKRVCSAQNAEETRSSSSSSSSTSPTTTPTTASSSTSMESPAEHIASRGNDSSVILDISNPNIRAFIQEEKGKDYIESVMNQTALPPYSMTEAYNALKNAIKTAVSKRSAAVSTTIPILNNLFLADNDILCFQCEQVSNRDHPIPQFYVRSFAFSYQFQQ
ncbi:hypothetical protein MUCCIDRAFT_167863 [Mucor lusitanicus CBS 277.49]|uniref:Uncharacterized protein n=1 Tax=Mucor lusitanicus CBS 277.49 TaxID=747725 RepID=A0A162YCX2_MUCCL|nr:hypothetical protein MUCCIDRAFT_167863 [Mucor lusitanicus CBS 277.49]